ncbi:MAG: phosphogluconate dehydrogenase C-terminal domain-containing protein [Ilumatobacteraceae bacterium]|nr:phosphogluconate dehydrogenase C-terminal domain-containing protein [Ilumatobacteraceae bacterium]
MISIALFGAGGKMGVRLATNLADSPYTVHHIEVSEAGRQRLLDETGLTCTTQADALADADVVILAVPDRLIGTILDGFVDELRPGTAVIMLDAAAPSAGKLPDRADLTYFVTHPCHPPIFNDETDPEAQTDYFGGYKAKQNIICALMQGPEDHYELCEQIARAFYAPVMTAHRCTVEQMIVLEPALSESVGATFSYMLRAAVDEATRRGVPEQAARDFLLGHLSILLAVSFDLQPGGRLSDGCMLAIEEAKPLIFHDDWLNRIFDPNAITASVESIVH